MLPCKNAASGGVHELGKIPSDPCDELSVMRHKHEFRSPMGLATHSNLSPHGALCSEGLQSWAHFPGCPWRSPGREEVTQRRNSCDGSPEEVESLGLRRILQLFFMHF